MNKSSDNSAPQFRTKLLQSGKTATGFAVPAEVVEQLGQGRKPPVRVTINGYMYRNTVAVMGGVFMIGVSAEHREKAKVAGGDMLDVTLELDDQPREVAVPPDFAKALKPHAAARAFFDSLSYSKKQGLVLPIEQAKTTETRERRIEKAVTQLRTGKL